MVAFEPALSSVSRVAGTVGLLLMGLSGVASVLRPLREGAAVDGVLSVVAAVSLLTLSADVSWGSLAMDGAAVRVACLGFAAFLSFWGLELWVRSQDARILAAKAALKPDLARGARGHGAPQGAPALRAVALLGGLAGCGGLAAIYWTDRSRTALGALSAAGALALLVAALPKRARAGGPSAASLERAAYRLGAWAFVGLTLCASATSLRLYQQRGDFWDWDVSTRWLLIAWLVLLGGLHLRERGAPGVAAARGASLIAAACAASSAGWLAGL